MGGSLASWLFGLSQRLSRLNPRSPRRIGDKQESAAKTTTAIATPQ